jgi:putative addiction module component (TIGR02574 family)
MTTKNLEQEALKLPPAKRIALAERLLGSVDDFATEEIREAWMDEIARRSKEFEDGTEPGIPAEKVHAEVRRHLREARRVSQARSK